MYHFRLFSAKKKMILALNDYKLMSHKFGIPFSSVTALNTIQRYSADATSQKFFRNLMWCGLRAEQWTHKPRKKLSLPLYHIYILLCENRLSNTFFCGNNTPTHLNFLYFEVWLPTRCTLNNGSWLMAIILFSNQK